MSFSKIPVKSVTESGGRTQVSARLAPPFPKDTSMTIPHLQLLQHFHILHGLSGDF